MSFGRQFDVSIMDKRKTKSPEARCKYGMKNLIYAAACSQHERGLRQQSKQRGNKEGGEPEGGLVIMQ